MKKIYALLCLAVALSMAGIKPTNAQCTVGVNNNFWLFSDTNNFAFTGFLCADNDHVGTMGATGYYDGDGYSIDLYAGTSVTFRTDSCTGNPVSLTIVDSNNVVISGAFTSSACPAALSFVAPYTGNYSVVLNLNGSCTGGGTTVIGQVYASIDPGSTPPPCPVEANVINDTLCGAIEITVDAPAISGNNSVAYLTDPLDGVAQSLGFNCDVLNNTLWYTFTAPSTETAMYIRISSLPGSGFHSFVGAFKANDTSNTCDILNLVYFGCVEGGNDDGVNNNVVIPFPSVTLGDVYYLMIDGFTGSTGGFTLAVQTPDLFNGIANSPGFNNGFNVYPNPASENLIIESSEINGEVIFELTNSIGQVVLSKSFLSFVKETLDIGDQPAGIYSLRMISGNSTIDKKIIITK